MPCQFSSLVEQMDEDHFDIAMSGFVSAGEQLEDVRLGNPYLYLNLALVVQDYRDKEFATLQSMRVIDGLRIGTPRFINDEVKALLRTV